MNLRELELFGTLMRVGTTIETARVLRMSQPSVSGHLKRLEARIGFSLFHRVGNRLEPTAEAHQLFADAGPIFATHTQIRGRLGELSVQAVRPVAISATPAVVEGYLGALLSNAGYEDWQKRLHLRVTEPEIDVRTGWADIGFQMAVPPKAEFHTEELARIPMHAVFRRQHPLASRRTLRLADLAGLPLVCYNPGFSPMGAAIRDAFEAQGLSYDPSCIVPFSSTVCHLVETCGGLGIIDELTVSRLRSPELLTRPVIDIPTLGLMAFHRRNEPLRAAVHDLLEALLRRG
ncbi:LysR family transcriptional regulator [Aurantimonas sp. MSK8Z-1]|uniref:LysR family transcriptional regulator n=1 Tax=Mangrovibrevibacter kandeliae TaxID=2968473 RepID=UPI00211784F4|nr:LysR family transcriptional regulator [Aurantimonas sp. MSK8Z-1]MCW4115896.1 LysR family transcriptional regulator [Aurantimonas sp. MSK8Z-1]